MCELWILPWQAGGDEERFGEQMNRHLSRTIAMQTLYEWDFRTDVSPDTISDRNIAAYQDDADADYVHEVVGGVIANVDKIDNDIARVAPEWPVDQISSIDKAVLRLAVYELLYSDEVPPKVAINEAVELGKTFGSESTSRFVNGVLGTLYRESPKYNPEDDKPKPEKQPPAEPGTNNGESGK